MKAAKFIVSLVILAGLVAIIWYANREDNDNRSQAAVEERDGPCDNVVNITGDTVSWEQTKTGELEGKTVTLEGYPELPFIMMMQNGRASVRLNERMNQGIGGMVMLLVEEGECENTMQPLSDDYDQSDMIFTDNAGEEIIYGESMRITGTAMISNGKCTVSVKKIEKIVLSYDYEKEAERLTDKNQEDLHHQMVYAEGVLSTPDEAGGIRLEMFLEDESLAFIVNSMIKFGPLNNQADDLEEQYTDEDILIRDRDGKKIRTGDKVRVYGMWNYDNSDLWVEQIVLLEK